MGRLIATTNTQKLAETNVCNALKCLQRPHLRACITGCLGQALPSAAVHLHRFHARHKIKTNRHWTEPEAAHARRPGQGALGTALAPVARRWAGALPLCPSAGADQEAPAGPLGVQPSPAQPPPGWEVVAAVPLMLYSIMCSAGSRTRAGSSSGACRRIR